MELYAYDKAYNEGWAYNNFEVDTVAPKIVSATPTGRRVSSYATVKIHFDDYVHNSKRFANIYERGSSSPLAVYRNDGDGQEMIELDPKRSLKRDTRYTVKVTTGVNDGANNLEAPYS